MGWKESLKTSLSKLKDTKNIEWVAVILIIAIIVSIYASTFNRDSNDQDLPTQYQYKHHETEEMGSSQSQEEKRLKEVLSVIQGAGKVEVMITYKSSKEIVTAMNTVDSTIVTNEEDYNGGTRTINQADSNTQPVTINDSQGSKPLILKEVEPEIKGVIVIAEGAGDVRVKMELLRAIQVVLGIKANQVEVFPMERNNSEE